MFKITLFQKYYLIPNINSLFTDFFLLCLILKLTFSLRVSILSGYQACCTYFLENNMSSLHQCQLCSTLLRADWTTTFSIRLTSNFTLVNRLPFRNKPCIYKILYSLKRLLLFNIWIIIIEKNIIPNVLLQNINSKSYWKLDVIWKPFNHFKLLIFSSSFRQTGN